MEDRRDPMIAYAHTALAALQSGDTTGKLVLRLDKPTIE
jgi:hypothetical protein